MNTLRQKTNWEKVRSAFQTIHLWIGLIGGLFIFVICLTGTIYTFADDIKKILNPDLYYVEKHGQQKTINELGDIVKRDIETDISGMIIPDADNEPYIFLYPKEGERRPVQLRINPYSGEILRPEGKEKGAAFFTTVFKLHRWLLMDTEVGRPIVGAATIMFAFGCLTGLVIWFPRRLKNWKQGLKIKTGKWKRLNHDLHNALGFYSFIFILVMALTGLVWSFEWYKEGYNSFLGASHLNEKKTGPSDQNKNGSEDREKIKDQDDIAVKWDDVYMESQKYFDYRGNTKITISKKSNEVPAISKTGTDFWAYANSDEVKIHPYSLELVEHKIFTDQPVGTQIARSYKAIHMGYIFGTGTKIIYFISCLIATSLPVTGVIIYINSLRKKKKRKKV